jgi:peroxiredoxin 2/4
VEVLGISVDSQYTHLAWKQTPVERGGIGPIRYPLVADLDKSISRTFGVLSGEAVALRGLFLIDRNGIVRHQVVNDLNLGRSVDEAMRMVDALQFTEKYGDVCPADWQEGQEAMKPTAEGVAQYLAKRAN